MTLLPDQRWLLPEGIEEILPEQATRLETIRRGLLDLYGSWGYAMVIPPFVDYMDSLLTGSGRDLGLHTFQLVDQLDGRTLGIRADMTPQVARLDAHHLHVNGPARLCYIGTVLRARPDGFGGSRSPLQIGAELFGHPGIESEVEIFRLMMATLERAAIEDVYLDLGHVGIYRELARQAALDAGQELQLFDAMQRKAISEIDELLGRFGVGGHQAELFRRLPELNGDYRILDEALGQLRGCAEGALQAVQHLRELHAQLSAWGLSRPLHYDLAELRGYHYKTGVVFAAFTPDTGQEIVRGGRYDAIGEVFGRARPAVGFSADLRVLLELGGHADEVAPIDGVLVPWDSDRALREQVEAIRRQGRRVVYALPGQVANASELGCTEQLVKKDQGWSLQPVG